MTAHKPVSAREAFFKGVDYVRDRSPAKAPPSPCMNRGCRNDATCMPRLYVPAHAMSVVRCEDVGSLMIMRLCDRHFYLLKASDFLWRDEVRSAIGEEFRRRGAIPNFDKACIGRVPLYDPDFKRGEKLEAISRRN